MTNRRIDPSALKTAAAGAKPPPAGRLLAAVEYVADQAAAEQLILFGSAARGDFGERSDFDFLVVRPANGTPVESRERWTQPKTGDGIDVLFVDAATLEKRRWTAGKVHCTALAEGTTVFTETGVKRVRTARDAGEQVADMVKKGRYEPSEAKVFLRHAKSCLKLAEAAAAPEDDTPEVACKMLQESAERALKALIIARGSPFAFSHDLRELWNRATELGERIEVEKNHDLLNEMSLYGSDKGYGTPSGRDPKTLITMFKPIAARLAAHAERRVPELITEWERSRSTTGRSSATAGGSSLTRRADCG